MSMEGNFPDKNQEQIVKRLDEMLPFLYVQESDEEKEYNKKMIEAEDLIKTGKLNEAIKLGAYLRENKPKKAIHDIEFTDEQINAYKEARGKIAEQLGYEVKDNDGKFLDLKKNGCDIQMKQFMLQSTFGFNGGRIKKIQIGKDGKSYCWDNGWDQEPEDEEVKKVFNEIVKYLN